MTLLLISLLQGGAKGRKTQSQAFLTSENQAYAGAQHSAYVQDQ